MVTESLTGSLGELVSVRIELPWRQLEDVLETLAGVSFPVNPSIRHGSAVTTVEFPAYSGQLDEVRAALNGWESAGLKVEVHQLWPELAADMH